MTNRIKAIKKVSRKYGVTIWGRANDPIIKRKFRPGQHGSAMHRETNLGRHLIAKQRVKSHYFNMKEKQFKKVVIAAKKMRGDVVDNFIMLLETRLDVAVYRSCMVPTMPCARQMINHKHFLINGKPVTIPSAKLKIGDVVTLKESSKSLAIFKDAIARMERKVPDYFEFSADSISCKFVSVPKLDAVPFPFDPNINMVIEYYSK